MSFGWGTAIWTAISVGASAAATTYSADVARKSANQANDQAIKAAKANAQAADEANNAANAKSPDAAAMMAANLAAGKAGASGTMITGPGGVDPNSLTLGKTSLIGG
jgi:hypothetical protein